MNIALVQINNSFSNQNYLPYSVGLVESYAKKHYAGQESLNFVGLIYKRMKIQDALKEIEHADIVGFSAYVWNIKMSLKLAKELKKSNPKCLIVFGGPQVPDYPDEFLKSNDFIDIAVHGEGEQPFTEILNNYTTRNFTNVSSISYIQDGTLVQNPRCARIKSLDDIPSPYLTGIFDDIMQKQPKENWIAFWETNRGCPFSCTFCDWGSAVASKINQFGLERIYEEIEWFSKNKIEFILLCDANFGILPRDLDIVNEVVKIQKETGYPNAISVQNTKNATERAYLVQKTLSDAGLNTGVTLSMQSMDTQTLYNVKRANISTKSFQHLQRKFTKDKIKTYTDTILALPGETYGTLVNGIDLIIENGQHNRIQFHDLSLLPNSELGSKESIKKFGMKTVESKIITMHGSLLEVEDESTQEMQDLVVATNSMPEQDWVKTRTYCWTVALLHFDKLLQIPLILTHNLGNIPYRKIFEAFTDKTILKDFPTLNEINQFFINKARDVQAGGEEHCKSKEWLNIWWYADEYTFIKLVTENKIVTFYDEVYLILQKILESNNSILPTNVLEDSIALNYALLRLPFDYEDEVVRTSSNIFELYNSMVINEPIQIEQTPHKYLIQKKIDSYNSLEKWCREVVWYGNKRGAYLHDENLIKQTEESTTNEI